MIMDNISLGTLASWFSDCKVKNETEGSSVQGKINPNSKQVSGLKIWNPWYSENKADVTNSQASHSVASSNSQIKLYCLPSASNQNMPKYFPIKNDKQGDSIYRPFQVCGTSSEFTSGPSCNERYKHFSGLTNRLALPEKIGGIDSGIKYRNCAQEINFEHHIHGSGLTNKNEFLNSKVPKAAPTVRPAAASCSQPHSEEHQEDKHFERLVLNQIEEFPPCDCKVPRPFDENLDGPFYTHLGVSESEQGVREIIIKRLNIKDNELRLEKVTYTGKEGKSKQGCPIAKWIIRRSSLNEKVLVLTRRIKNHSCKNSVIVIGICLWDGLPEHHATELYDYLSITLPKYGAATYRRCALNEKRTCACQGWNESSGGASFSFGCSWSMYYNGCKFARSNSSKKFYLKPSVEESLILEHHLQTLATVIAPIYKRVAPISFRNQTMFESAAPDCRLGYKEGRPWSGVTAVVDFCTHSHKDFNNMNNGCTTVLTLTKHRGMEKPEDEQLHVLPLCVLDTTDKWGNGNGTLECLTSFPALARIRSTPFVCERKQRQLKASLKKSIPKNAFLNAKKQQKSVKLSGKGSNKSKTAQIIKKEMMQPVSSNSRNLLGSATQTPTVLPGFSQFVSSLSNFGKFQDLRCLATSQKPSLFTKADSGSYGCDFYSGTKSFSSNNVIPNGYSVNHQVVGETSNFTAGTAPVTNKYVSHNNVPSAFNPGTKRLSTNNAIPNGYSANHQVAGETSNFTARTNPVINKNVSHNNVPTVFNQREQVYKGNFKSLPEQSYVGGQRCAPTFSPSSDAPHTSNPHRANVVPVLGLYPNDDPNEIQNNYASFNFPTKVERGDDNSNPGVDQEILIDNCDAFTDNSVGGVAIALTHGSLLFEVAKRELHATTAVKSPDRSKPTRLSLVFYQHKNMNKANHGKAEYEKKVREKNEKKADKMMQRCQEESDPLPDESMDQDFTDSDSDIESEPPASFSLHSNESHGPNYSNTMPFINTPNIQSGYINQEQRMPYGVERAQMKHGSANYYYKVDGSVNPYLSSFSKNRKL